MTSTTFTPMYNVSAFTTIEVAMGAKQYMTDKWVAYRYEAFWKRIDKKGPEECWNWTGLTSKSHKTPYGALGWRGKLSRPHRVAYELAFGDITDGAMVLHKCDNTLCCNPAHLYLGDHAQNIRDMVERARRKGASAGANKGRAKLTQEQADAIRVMYAAGGVSQDALAKLYGVSQFAVSAIVRNKRYAS